MTVAQMNLKIERDAMRSVMSEKTTEQLKDIVAGRVKGYNKLARDVAQSILTVREVVY